MRVLGILFALVVAGVLVLAIVGPRSYVGICADTKAHVRVPDQKCEPKTTAEFDWVYYNSNDDVPAVGQQAEDNIAEAPEKDDDVKRGGVPAEGQQASSNGDDNVGNSGGGVEPGGSDVGVNSGDEGGENAGSSGGGEDGE